MSSAASTSHSSSRALHKHRIDYPSTLVRVLLKNDWVVYAKPAFGEPTRVLRYLGRYTHRVAISNQRLLSFDGHRVSFRWKDYAHGNKQRIMTLIRKRVPAPLLPTCAAQRLRPHPPLRLSRQRTPGRSHRARSPAACMPASADIASHQLPASYLALPALRSQHAHRAQPHRATTGISMRPSRHFLIPTLSTGQRRCGSTSPPTCVFSAKLRPHDPFLLACSSRNHSPLRDLSAFPPYPDRVFQPLCPIHAGQFAPLAP